MPANWLDELNALLRRTGRPLGPAPVAPRERDQMPTVVTGPGTPAVLPGKGQPQPGGPTPFPDISPSDIAIARFTNRYRRWLGIGQAAGLSDYLGALFPALMLNQLGPEHAYPEEVLGWGQTISPQTAAILSRVQVFNPAGSGVLAVLEISATRLNTAGLVAVIPQNANLGATAGITGVRDLRLGQASGPSVAVGNVRTTLSHDETAVLFGANAVMTWLTSGAAQNPGVSPPIPLPPGFGVLFAPGTILGGPLVNEGLALAFAVREIPLALLGAP